MTSVDRVAADVGCPWAPDAPRRRSGLAGAPRRRRQSKAGNHRTYGHTRIPAGTTHGPEPGVDAPLIRSSGMAEHVNRRYGRDHSQRRAAALRVQIGGDARLDHRSMEKTLSDVAPSCHHEPGAPCRFCLRHGGSSPDRGGSPIAPFCVATIGASCRVPGTVAWGFSAGVAGSTVTAVQPRTRHCRRLAGTSRLGRPGEPNLAELGTRGGCRRLPPYGARRPPLVTSGVRRLADDEELVFGPGHGSPVGTWLFRCSSPSGASAPGVTTPPPSPSPGPRPRSALTGTAADLPWSAGCRLAHRADPAAVAAVRLRRQRARLESGRRAAADPGCRSKYSRGPQTRGSGRRSSRSSPTRPGPSVGPWRASGRIRPGWSRRSRRCRTRSRCRRPGPG